MTDQIAGLENGHLFSCWCLVHGWPVTALSVDMAINAMLSGLFVLKTRSVKLNRNGITFLQLQFNNLVYPSGVNVYETWYAGAVVKLMVFNIDTGVWVTVWQVSSPQRITSSRIFSIPMTVRVWKTTFNRIHIWRLNAAIDSRKFSLL